jgi:anaerobic selenocysteine-containing dehydrogenase
MGMQRHAGGGMALRTLYAIPGVTGDWRLPGGGACYSTNWYRGDKRALRRDDLRAQPARTLTMTRLGETLESGGVHALIVYGANPVASNPDQRRVRRALAREDLFTVVMEQFPTDTVDYADIVLPATMQTEHLDVHEAYGHMYVQLNSPAVEPPGECLSTTETFRRLARRLGLTEPALYDDDETLARTFVGDELFERLQREGFVRLDVPRPFVPYADGFPTPSGKLEFVSERAARDGHDRLPAYTPPAEATAGLALVAPASHWFLNSTFANKPDLRARAGEPRIEIHPDDAAARGLRTGDRARVDNARGGFEADVVVSDRVRPGVVASTKGHWLKHVRGRANVNATVDERDSDMGGGAVFHDNHVEVTAVGGGRLRGEPPAGAESDERTLVSAWPDLG